MTERISWMRVAGTLIASSIAISFAVLFPRDTSGQVAVVFPPWVAASEAVQMVAAGGADIVDIPTARTIIARSPAPGFVARLYSGGAIAVLAVDPFGCHS
ncbi:MAG: hypothetical protein ACM30I_10145 [Gemmatimonas sp.]